MKCRFCGAPVLRTFVDLGAQPLANSYVEPEQANDLESFYRLHVRVCDECLLVQLPELASAEEIFSRYAYVSSMSTSWLEHCRRFVSDAVPRFAIAKDDLVIEVASNDGYLLRYFVERNHRVLGIEPAANVAVLAEKVGVPTVVRFFGEALARELAEEGKRAKLIVANNVLAHVPDINDFTQGFRVLLAPGGVITVEFPHLLELIRENQFDTIYHEHFSYLSLDFVRRLFDAHRLRVFDVERLPTHGGSLRVFAAHAEEERPIASSVAELLAMERAAGMMLPETYSTYASRVCHTKWALLEMLIGIRKSGKRVVGYGAPAKGNTLLNYCGIRSDLLDYTVDRSPLKQGRLLPGSRIPIKSPEELVRDKPEFVLILPWNLKEEIQQQMEVVRSWGGQFIVPIPEPRVLP